MGGFEEYIVDWSPVGASDVVDPEFVLGVEDGKELVICYEGGGHVFDGYF